MLNEENLHEFYTFWRETIGPSGVIGWQSITNLATALFELRNVSVLSAQAEDNIIRLWKELPERIKIQRWIMRQDTKQTLPKQDVLYTKSLRQTSPSLHLGLLV